MHSHVPHSHCVSIHSKLFRGFSVQIRADHCLSTAFLVIASPRRSFSWICFAVPSLLIAKLISGVLCLRTALSIFAKLIPCFSARRSPAPPYAIQFQCCVLPSKAPLSRSCASHCLACALQFTSPHCFSSADHIGFMLVQAFADRFAPDRCRSCASLCDFLHFISSADRFSPLLVQAFAVRFLHHRCGAVPLHFAFPCRAILPPCSA